MTNKAVIRDNLLNSTNKGYLDMNTVKVYHDMKGRCACGGQFNARKDYQDPGSKEVFNLPVCGVCDSYPKHFWISAYGLNIDGEQVRFRIRNDQNKNRISSFFQCIFTLQQIERELKQGTFDYRKYMNKEASESYLFENFLARYEGYCKLRLEGKRRPAITPNGYLYKDRLWTHLKKVFTGKDIAFIKAQQIEEFRKTYNASEDTINKCLSELRTILTEAVKEDMLNKLPDFGRIEKSKERETTMTLDEGIRILEHVQNPIYKGMLTLLSIYPVRPCEIPVLKWKNVNFFSKEVTFETHISHKQDIDGRKSRKKGEKYASLTLPLTPEAANIFKSQVRSLDPEAYIFKGVRNSFVSLKAMSEAWEKAVVLAGAIPNERTRYHKYELKHALLSEMNKRTGGNLKLLEQASGVDYQTLLRKYIRNEKEDVKALFK